MTSTAAQRERALKLAEKLIEIAPETEQGLIRRALQIRDRLKTPMDKVLAKVLPGSTVTMKCKSIGITRQAYYAWLKGEYRPNPKQAKRLAALTGYKFEDIRGRAVAD